jgi:hypothetical protein
MLKAAIVYLPGTAGSFLYRVLTLSERTGPCDTREKLNYNCTINAEIRLDNYTSWNANHWKQGESKWFPAYKSGLVNFVDYEVTPAWIINPWHPDEFLHHDQQSIVWETGAWPWLIFITVEPDHKEFLLRNQKTKQYHLDWNNEITALNKLRTQYANRCIDIKFDSFFNEESFVDAVSKIDQKLELNLNFNYVRLLWKSWYTESQKVWV